MSSIRLPRTIASPHARAMVMISSSDPPQFRPGLNPPAAAAKPSGTVDETKPQGVPLGFRADGRLIHVEDIKAEPQLLSDPTVTLSPGGKIALEAVGAALAEHAAAEWTKTPEGMAELDRVGWAGTDLSKITGTPENLAALDRAS